MILIDSSLGSRDLIKYPPLDNPSLACLANLSVSEGTKSSADVCFPGNGPDGKLMIGIEFKEISELLSSIHSGRFQATQIETMTQEYQVCYLVTYGEYRCGDEGYLEVPATNTFISSQERAIDNKKEYFWYVKGIPYQGPFDSKSEAIQAYRTLSRKWKEYTYIGKKSMVFGYLESALLSLSRAGIRHKHFTRIEDCAQWIGCAYRSWSKEWSKHHFFRTFDKSSDKSPALMPGVDPVIKRKMEIARSLCDGMGFERAMAAAKHFRTAKDMVTATVEEWLEVPGIGKVIAKEIVRSVNAEKDEKGNKVKDGKVKIEKDTLPNLDIFR